LNLKEELKGTIENMTRHKNTTIADGSGNNSVKEAQDSHIDEWTEDVVEDLDVGIKKVQKEDALKGGALVSESLCSSAIRINDTQPTEKKELTIEKRSMITDDITDVEEEAKAEIKKLKIALESKSVELIEMEKKVLNAMEEFKFKAAREIELENKLNIQNETIASLEERLVLEHKAMLELEAKLSPQDMRRRIEEGLEKDAKEIQENNLSNIDWYAFDYYHPDVPLTRNKSGIRGKLYLGLSNTNPQIKWSSILGLVFKRETRQGNNYHHCVAGFLKSIAPSISSVFMESGDVVLSLKSAALLKKALMQNVHEESLESRLEDLKPRVRMVPDDYAKEYILNVFYDEQNLSSQSREDLKKMLKEIGRIVSGQLTSEKASFRSLIAFVRALTNPKLVKYHRVLPQKSCFELIGGNGENNYFKGQVCLTESNLMSIHYIGEQEHGFAKSFSKFLQDSRIQKVDQGRNGRLLVIFYNLKALEDCLLHSCQFNCNNLAKLVHQPVRSMLIPRMSYFSLQCPPTAAKKDFACYKDTCKLEENPRRISSRSKVKLIEVLRDVKVKYPDTHFSESNFVWTRRAKHDSESHQNEAVGVNEAFEEHPLEQGADDGDVEGDATSDYEESIFSEITVGVDGEARN